MVCRGMLAGLSVGDIMRPFSSFIGPQDLVTQARAKMRSAGLRALPVVDGGKLIGIVTERGVMQVTSTRSNIPVAGIISQTNLVATPSTELADLALQMVDVEISDVPVVRGQNDKTVVGLVKLEDVLRSIAGKIPATALVGKVMVKNVVTCEPEDDIPKVWDLMGKTNYSGLPVVRYDKRKQITEVIGMVTRTDILSSGAIRLSEESDKGRFRNPPKVKAIMRTPGIVVSPQTPLADAVDTMIKKDIGRLPVVEGRNLVGIVSRSDVVGFACR